MAPIGLPATPGNADLTRRRSVKERTPRQLLAAHKLAHKSASKSLGGNWAGRNESPGDLLRQLSRSKPIDMAAGGKGGVRRVPQQGSRVGDMVLTPLTLARSLMKRMLMCLCVVFAVPDLPPGTPDTPDPAPHVFATAPNPNPRRSSLLSRPSYTAQPTPPPSDPLLDPSHPFYPSTTQDITASPLASTSTASPFGTTATLSLSLALSAPRSATASLHLSRAARYPIPDAPAGFRHPHFVPGYGRQSMGSPGVGRRASEAMSGLGVRYGDEGEEGEEEASVSFEGYGKSRRSEVYSEMGNVSVGASEGYFEGSRSVRASLAVSQRSSLGTAVGELAEEGDDRVEEGAFDGERSLSRISSVADEEVHAFSRFRLSSESDASASGEEGGDVGDEEGALALSDPAGIDWDDALRDVGRGGGDEEEEEEIGSVVSMGSMDKGKGRQLYDDQDEDLAWEDDYYGQDSDDQAAQEGEVDHDSFDHPPVSASLPRAPPLGRVAAARKKRALPKKVHRTTPSGACLVDLPTAKVKAAFEHATRGAFTLSPEGVDAVLDA